MSQPVSGHFVDEKRNVSLFGLERVEDVRIIVSRVENATAGFSSQIQKIVGVQDNEFF